MGPLCRERSKALMALQLYGLNWNLLDFPLDLLGAVAAILQDKFGYVVMGITSHEKKSFPCLVYVS